MLDLAASPSLIGAALDTAKQIVQPKPAAAGAAQPKPGQTLYDAMLDAAKAKAVAAKETKVPDEPTVPGLGSGSDFLVFLSHLGVPSMDISMSSDPDIYGVYHSVYDSYYWMSTFGDPGFKNHAAVASFWAILAQQLADETVLPLEYIRYAAKLTEYTNMIKTANLPGAATLKWPRIEKAIDQLRAAASVLEMDRSTSLLSKDPMVHRRFSDRCFLAERAFLLPRGLQRSAWFRHSVYSPSAHDSYASQAFPGIYDSLFEGNLEGAKFALEEVTAAIRRAALALSGDNI